MERSKPPAPSTIAPLPEVIGPLTLAVPTASGRNSGFGAVVDVGLVVAAAVVSGLVTAGLVVGAGLVVEGSVAGVVLGVLTAVTVADVAASGEVEAFGELDEQAAHVPANSSATVVNERCLMAADRTLPGRSTISQTIRLRPI